MTTEQNPPEAAVPQQGTAPQGQSQGHRRRRRRRKGHGGGGGNPAAANAAKGQPQAGAQAPPPAAPPPPQQQPQKAKPSSQGRFFHKNGQQSNGSNGQFNGQGNGQFNGQGNGQGNGQSNNNQGNGNNQGGRRKTKARRQQVFVGPMDHSYRVVNGNMADAPPSTMEYRSNVNGNGNGNGYFAEPAYIEQAAGIVREDAPIRIYCFIEDLFFLAKIQETARKLGIKVGFVKGDKESVAKLVDSPEGERPSLIVFDLNNAAAKPLTLIPKIKSKLKRGTSVIGFLSHLQGDLKVKALEAGCDMVMPRSAFSQNLPNLLRRHGLDEELEAIEA